MKKDANVIDKNGFTDKFFDDLAKEGEKIESLANRQKELKQKHNQSVLQ
ncbi:MAG TPA: hypothetical protein VFM64_02340 [Candidatus Nitrosotenuis sp.]|nr:hypothetical protein [Candidatus Nitrosotenuis sp.]